MNKDEVIEINGEKYVLEKNKPPTPPINKHDKYRDEKFLLRLWRRIANEKEIEAKKKELETHEKNYRALKKKYEERLNKLVSEEKKVKKNTFLLFIKRLFGFQRERAVIFDKDGYVVDIVNIKPENNSFSYKNNEYTLEREKNPSRILLKRFLEVETYYLYNIETTGALQIKNPTTNQYLDPKSLHALLNTRQLINLNKANNMLGDLFNDPKKLLLIGVVVIGAYILLSGGLNAPTT